MLVLEEDEQPNDPAGETDRGLELTDDDGGPFVLRVNFNICSLC